MKYEVIAYFSEIIQVEAENETEAISYAKEQLKNINTAPIVDYFEVEEIDD